MTVATRTKPGKTPATRAAAKPIAATSWTEADDRMVAADLAAQPNTLQLLALITDDRRQQQLYKFRRHGDIVRVEKIGGDDAVYEILLPGRAEVPGAVATCTCPARTECKHIRALRAIRRQVC